MADYDPELRARLQELDRELEVGSMSVGERLFANASLRASPAVNLNFLADDMTFRRATLPRRGKQWLLDTPAAESTPQHHELTRASQISEAADLVIIAVCSPPDSARPSSPAVSLRPEHTLPRNLDTSFKRWPPSFRNDLHDLR